MVTDCAHGVEVSRPREGQSVGYLPNKVCIRNVEGITHEAFREECGMLEIDDVNVIVVGEYKVAPFDIVVTEA